MLKERQLHYRIIVEGHVGPRVESVFPDLSFEVDGERTVLVGPTKDQAQLHGILALIRDLNAPLVAVERL